LSERAALEARVKSVTDRAATAQSAVDTTTSEKVALEMKLAEAEKTTAELRSAVTTTAQAAAQEKATLEVKVDDLQQDLVLTRVYLNTANDQIVDLDT
jgi:uncharacterized coiled-coil protein SlyX